MRRLILCLMVLGLCLIGANAFAQGNDGYTKLLLHCNGPDGSTNFVDDSASHHTVTAIDNAQLDTSEKKFGTASGLFSENYDFLSISDSVDWDFGTGDFTIDFWVRFSDIERAKQALFGKGNGSGGDWIKCEYNEDNTKKFHLF